MPSIINLPGRRLFRFALGEPPEPELELEPYLRWVLADYRARRDEQWRLPLQVAGVVLTKLYYEEKAAHSDALLTRLLAAFGFYGVLVKYARHFAREALEANPDSERAVVALAAIGSFASQDCIPIIEQHLANPNAQVRRAAFVSLAKVARAEDFATLDAAAANDPELTAIARVGRRRFEFAQAKDMPAFVRETLSHPDFYEDLVGMAGLIGADIAALFLPETALGPTERARAARVLGLARVRVRKAMRVALDIALEPKREAYLRRECVVFLGRTRAQFAEELLPLLSDWDPEIVSATIVALGEIGDPIAIGSILNLYDTAGGAYRADIELAAYRMSTPLDRASYEAWARGELELTPHSGYFFHGGFSTRAPEAFYVPLLQHPDLTVRREAALLLGLFGSSAAAPALRAFAVKEPDELTHTVAGRAASLARSRAPHGS